MAVMTISLAKPVGKLTDRLHPRLLTAFGFTCLFIGLLSLTFAMNPDTSIWWTVPPMLVFGVGNAFVWAPNSATATRNLPVQLAGAGSGVYNATRQVGAVLGSAAIAVLIDSRLAAEGLPSFNGGADGATGGALPPEVAQAFSDAMATAVLLPVAAFVIGFVAVLFFEKPRHQGWTQAAAPESTAQPAGEPG
jgi:MFS family permease